jgi:hypothetical protein
VFHLSTIPPDNQVYRHMGMTQIPDDDKRTYQDLARMIVYVHILNVNVDAVKRNNAQLKRAAAAIVFSLLMAFVLYIPGFLGGNYLWSHFGPPANDPDQISALICGLLVGGSMALTGVATILWKFWPRT